MDAYLDLSTGQYPVTLEEIRKTLNKISLPQKPTEEQLRRFGFCRVVPTERPAGTGVKEKYPRLIEGRFHQSWEVVQNVDISSLKQTLRRRLTAAYEGKLTKGWPYEDYCLDIADNDQLSLVFLECLSLREEDSDESVTFHCTDEDVLEVPWEIGLEMVKSIVKYKRDLKRAYATQVKTIRECRSVDDCENLKRKFDVEGAFRC